MLKVKWLELTDEKKEYNGLTLRRTKYIRNVRSIKKGTYGPWVENFEKIYFEEECEISDETILLGTIRFESRVTTIGKTIIDEAFFYLENLIIADSTIKNILIKQENICGAGKPGVLRIINSKILPVENNNLDCTGIICNGTASISQSNISFKGCNSGIDIDEGCFLDISCSDLRNFSNRITVSDECGIKSKIRIIKSYFRNTIFLRANTGESSIVESAAIGKLDFIGKFNISKCTISDETIIQTYYGKKSAVSLFKCDIGSVEKNNKIVFIAKEKGEILANNSCFYDYSKVESDTNKCFITDSILSGNARIKNSSVSNCRVSDKAYISNNFHIENYTICGDATIGQYLDGTDIGEKIRYNTKNIVGNSVKQNKLTNKFDFYMLPGFFNEAIAMYCLLFKGNTRKCVILEPGIAQHEKYMDPDEIIKFIAEKVSKTIGDKNDLIYMIAEKFLKDENIIQRCTDKIMEDFPGNDENAEIIKNDLILFWYCVFYSYINENENTKDVTNIMSQFCLLDIKEKTFQPKEILILTETIAKFAAKNSKMEYNNIICKNSCIINSKTKEKWWFIPEARNAEKDAL